MNDWALFYANDVLVNNKEHHISLFVKLIHNQIENLNVKYTYCELQEMENLCNKKAVKWLKEFLEINFNFKVKIEIDFDTEAVTPFYVVSKNKIILPYKFMLLKSSNNILDHEIFNFFLFHESGHAVLNQNSPQIYKIKMIQDIFYYLGKKYSQINLRADKKKIFLNLKQVYREFLPDFIAIYLLEKKFSMCVNWNEFLSCFEYFKTKTEMCTIFAFDTHAPIEARLYVSKMAVDYFRKHDNKN